MVNTKRLKYLGWTIALQEVPDEISLVISVSGCPHKCEGCHSKYLWEYKGNYVSEDLPALIEEYGDYITCVCFMGGDQNPHELSELCEYVHQKHLKCCLYSGLNALIPEMSLFDYVKIGRYIDAKGGLDKPTTNQRMYKLISDEAGNTKYEDITYMFRRKEYAENN